jgi:hypothetical protein
MRQTPPTTGRDRPPAAPVRDRQRALSVTRRSTHADLAPGGLAVRRNPAYDPYDDHDDPRYDPPPNVRRIATSSAGERSSRRGEVRPLRPTRRVPPKRGPDWRVWFIRGSIGIAALAGLWLGLQALFPIDEARVTQAPTPSQPLDASAVGAPEPPASQAAAQQPAQAVAQPPVQAVDQQPAQAAAQQPAAPAPTMVTQPAPVVEGDRLPGLPTPDPAATPQAAPQQPPVAAAQPTTAPPAAEPQPREETPSQQPAGTPTLAPIPPAPESQPAAAQPAPPQAQQPAPKPAAKPQAPPPPPPAAGGPFALSASASPANPISEQANVTITVRATLNGAPMAGAACMATIHYRTNTVKQPNGGFVTNSSGVASFVLDARGTTYGYYVPVDVTCSGRGGTATARTGFTPVRAAR